MLPVEDEATLPPLATPAPSPAQPLPPQQGYYPPPVPAIPLPPPDFAGGALPPSAPRERRPGIVTALSIGAVAGGCLGILMAVAIAIGAFAFVAAGDAAGRSVAASAASRAAAAPPPPPPALTEQGPSGLPQPQRVAIIDALKYLEFISPAREEQLDVMLAKAGAQIFPPGQVERTRDKIKSAVSESGELYSADPSRPGPIFFVTPTGRLEVHDERAVFQPNDRSIGTVRTYAGAAPGTQGLSIVQVGDVIAQAQSACGNVLSPAQQQTLRVLLLQPQQDLVSPRRVKSAVKSALVTPAGVRLQFNSGGGVVLGPMGQLIATAQIDPPRVSRGAFATIELLAVALIGLAVFLLVAAAMTLRKSTRTLVALRVYAWAKVVATLALWATVWWMIDDFVGRAVAMSGSGASATSLPPVLSGAAAVQNWLVLFALAGCVIPVALLLATRTRAARDHFAGARTV